MQLAPNIALQFSDLPFEERIRRVADLGFSAVDLFGTDDLNLNSVGAVLRQRDVVVSMVVGSPLAFGLNDPACHEAIERSVTKVAQDAAELRALNVVVLGGSRLPRVAASRQSQAIVDGLERLAPIAERYQITIVLEMLNSTHDHPGYYVDSTELMIALVRAVKHPRVKALYDIYHAGIMRGNVVEDIRAGIDVIGHFHVAGIPGRRDPIRGEQNYPFICRAIDELGYTGFIGLEYAPSGDSGESVVATRNWIQGTSVG